MGSFTARGLALLAAVALAALDARALDGSGPAITRVAAAGSDDPAPAPLVGEPTVRWSFAPLEFEAEPLVLGERVVVTGRDATGRRALVLLDATDGRMLSRTLFNARAPLEVALGGERIAVKAAENRVDVYRVQGARLLAERAIVHASSVSAPRLGSGPGLENELLVREGGELVRYDLGSREARWRTRVAGAFRGAPAPQGEHVFGLWYDERNDAHLARLERGTGRVLADTVVGRHSGARAPEEGDAFELVVHEQSVFLHFPIALLAASGAELPWARVPLEGERFGSPVSLHDYLAAPLETADGWVVPERTPDGPRWLLIRRENEREHGLELASALHHAWLTASLVPASRAGDVLYLGPAAADLDSLQVLWKRTPAPTFRPVPVPGGLLVVEGNTLRRLGGEPVASAPADERARALSREQERTLAERLAALASRALRAGDLELAERLLAEAEQKGATGRTLTLTRAGVERQQALAGTARPDPRQCAALLAEEREARERVVEELAKGARLATDSGLKQALLRELFRQAPEHPAGLDALHALLPQGAELVAAQAPSWLDFLSVSARLPIELALPAAEGAASTSEEKRLSEERVAWRPDVVGYRSPRLAVVTAGAAPGAVARALAAGELLCDVLESTFRSSRGAAERLQLVLYPTREEYLARSGTDLGGLESVLGWTAGHYDLTANVSRMFLPDDDEENARLIGVYAHELTHHWLAARSAFGPPRSQPATKGFWIVEAIATWAEELHLDPARGTWRSDNPRAASLDTLANVRASDLIPWRALLAASFDDYRTLETRPTCTTRLTWQLGTHADRGPMQLFYAQGGALAHYLFDAEDGRQRELLLQAVEAFYRGAPLDVAATLRLSPEELGTRVQAFARTTVGL